MFRSIIKNNFNNDIVTTYDYFKRVFSKLLIEHFGKKSNLNSFHMQTRLNILPNDDDVIKVV